MRRTIKKILKGLNNDLPAHIKKMRIDAGFSQKDLASKLPIKLDRSTISNWENGKTSVGFTEFILVCVVCGQSPKAYLPNDIEEKLSSNKEKSSD